MLSTQPPNTRKLYRTRFGHDAVAQHYDAMLRRYPVTYRSHYVPTRYGATHVVRSGSEANPPLLLLHGLGVHAMMWKPNVQALSRRFRVYAVDVLGDGGRSAPTRPSMLDASYANWLVDVLDGLNIDRTNIVGMSLGGWLALTTALYHPGRVRRSVLICPAGIVTLNTSLITQAMFAFTPLALAGEFSVPHLMAQICSHSAPDIKEMVYLTTKHHYAKPVPPLPILADSDLRQIHTPTAVIVGGADEMFHPRQLVNRATHMPGLCSAEIVPGAGHGINVKRAPLINERITDFMRAED